MAGNAWEWCLNNADSGWNDINYVYDHNRVLRGGSFAETDKKVFQCSYRHKDSPSISRNDYGFRIARTR